MNKLQMANCRWHISILHSLPRRWEWIFIVALLLLGWGLRLACLEAVPPGWRDDDLIEMFALAGEVLAGHPTFYFTGASGHEPLYHTLRAGILALVGINSMGGHLLSIASGVLTIPLTYALCRRLFGQLTALVAAACLTFSFWSLMYSRFGLRHQAVVPPALTTFYLLWSMARSSPGSRRRPFVAGIFLAAALYTYTASRLLPLILVGLGLYLALAHRKQFRRWWRPLLVTLFVAAVLTVPLWVAIAQGRSEAAAQGIGADARVAELSIPLRELWAGAPRPLLENIWTTLGMFHATGDPEWLYNIPGRPVFNYLGGALFWAGVVLCVYRWRQPRYFFLLLWLGFGLFPAFISTPPASLSHTILAQPVAHILPAVAVVEVYRWIKLQIANGKSPFVHSSIRRSVDSQIRHALLSIVHCSLFIFLATNGIRDLRDYFVVWPQRGMVRFLYRADYREAARYLDIHPEITDVAISSALLGPWDRLALDVDVRRADVAVRLFNPERALVYASGRSQVANRQIGKSANRHSAFAIRHSYVLLTSSLRPTPPIADFLEASTTPPQAISPYLTLYTLPPTPNLQPLTSTLHSPLSTPPARFANGLELVETRWVNGTAIVPGQEATLLTIWRVATPLALPPLPIVANPPPPGVYSGPRLAAFVHVLAADGTFVASDDGLWVDPLTLQPGDWLVQAHYLVISPGAPGGPYALEMGLYDPLSGDRWPVVETNGQPGPDRVSIAIEEEP